MGDETVLGFKVTGVESLDALTESIQNIQGAMSDLSKQRFDIGNPKQAEAEVKKVRKAIQSVLKEYEHAAHISASKGFGLVPGRKQAAQLTKLARNVKKEEEAILSIRQKMRRLEEDDPRREQARKEIAHRQKMLKRYAKEGATQTKLLDRQTARHMEAVNEIEDFRKKRFGEHAKGMAQDAMKAFKSVASADPFGLADSLDSAFDRAEKGLRSKGAAAGEKGQKGRAMMYKALGKAAKAMSRAARVMSAAQGIWDMIKDAMDMQADLNASILDTTGSLQMMGATWGEFGEGAARAHKLLGRIRKEVSDWGEMYRTNLSPQEQMELLAVFERQNITIKEMADNIEAGNKNFKKFTDYTWMAVRLQKNLGLEMQETVEAISFFTRDMGVSLKDVDRAFHQIAQNAIEANMNTRDFFATVMQVSSNMALYGNRVAEVAVLLNKLGKALGPQQAKQALQGIVDQWRQMGDEQRIQMTLLAGTGAVLKRVRADARAQFANMRDDLVAQMGEGGPLAGLMRGKVKVTAKDIKAEDISNVTDEQIAALNKGTEEQQRLGRSIESLRAMQREANRGGVTGAANAMAFAGPGAGIQAFNDIATKRFGKPINKLTGLQAIAYRKLTGIGLDQFRQLQALQTQFRGEIGILTKAVKDDKMSPEQEKQFTKLATVMGKSPDELKKLIKAGKVSITEQEYLSSLTKEQQEKALANADVMETTAEQHLSETRKISKILENIIAKIMMTVADILSGIWNAVIRLFKGWDKTREMGRLQKLEDKKTQAIREKRQELIDVKEPEERKRIQGELSTLEQERQKMQQIRGRISSGAISSPDAMVSAMQEAGVGAGIPQLGAGKGRRAVSAGYGAAASFDKEDQTRMAAAVAEGMTLAQALTPATTAPMQVYREGFGEEGLVPFDPSQLGLNVRAEGMQGLANSVDALVDPVWAKKLEALMQFMGVSGRRHELGAMRQRISMETKEKAKAEGRTATREEIRTAEQMDPEYQKALKDTSVLDAVNNMVEWQKSTLSGLRDMGLTEEEANVILEDKMGVVAEVLSHVSEKQRPDTLDTMQELLVKLSDEAVEDAKFTKKKASKDERQGLKLQKETNRALADEIVKAQETAEARRLAAELGIVGNLTEEKVAAAKAGAATPENQERARRLEQLWKRYDKNIDVKDAYFEHGGFAKLAAGDYVINKQAFQGPTMRGGEGAMLPQALAQTGGGRTGGAGNVTIVNNINGGDTARIQRLIVEQIRYIERRRAAGQSV
jgi:hypothetical protein